MPIDSQIALGVQQPANPLAQYAQLAQLQGLQNQNRAQDLQFQTAERAQTRQNKLQELLSMGGNDPASLESKLLGAGFLDESTKLGKDRRENSKLDNESMKAKAEAENKQFQTAHEKLGATLNILSGVKDQTSFDQAKAYIQSIGGDVSKMPAQFDPAFVANAGQQVLTQQQRIEQAAKARGLDIQAATQQEAGRHNRASEGLTARGQNMTNSRAQQTLAQGKIPAGYRANADGTLSFIPGGPADPEAARKAAPTEFQGKSAGFGSRAQEANKIINATTGKASPSAVNAVQGAAAIPAYVGGRLIEAGANYLSSDDSQKMEQAQRDFVNAVLRQESGAAISSGEFDNAKRQYFPQPGDSEAKITQKARNRQLAVDGFMNNAGRAIPKGGLGGGATGSFEQPPSANPNLDALLNKYK